MLVGVPLEGMSMEKGGQCVECVTSIQYLHVCTQDDLVGEWRRIERVV